MGVCGCWGSPRRAPPCGRLVEDPVAVRKMVLRDRDCWQKIGGVRVEFVVVGTKGWQGSSCCGSSPRVLGQGRKRQRSGRGLSFRVAPGSVSAVSASVRKGIWRAWWRPPCYLVQAQKGVSRAFLPTCDHSLSA